MLLFSLTLLLFAVLRETTGDAHAPCYECHIYERMHRDASNKPTKYINGCPIPCKPCPQQSITCQEGVAVMKDGCNCCYMCARQQGESCNKKDVCDNTKGLECDRRYTKGNNGICRAKEAKPCEVNGKIFKDGTQWKRDCRTQCTCQNGNYGCVSLCHQELTKPNLPSCQLVSIRGQCCREWMCNIVRTRVRQLPPPKSDYQNMQSAVTPTAEKTKCNITTSSWSQCSQTCGYGISMRESNDNAECKVVQQQRICIVRKCDLPDKKLRGKKCKATSRSERESKLTYKNCTTTRAYRPRYCASCKRHRNCIPVKTKTVALEFECEKGEMKVLNYMWIKKCKCLHSSNSHSIRREKKKKLRKDKKRTKGRVNNKINETA